MKTTLLALAAAGLPLVCLAGSPPTVNVNIASSAATVPVVVTNPVATPVNVAVVNGDAPQPVNAQTRAFMGTAQYWVKWSPYYNGTDLPVMLTHVGLSNAGDDCSAGPEFMEATLKPIGEDESYPISGAHIAKVETGDGLCHYAGALPNSIVIPPATSLWLKLYRSTAGDERFFYAAISGFVMQ